MRIACFIRSAVMVASVIFLGCESFEKVPEGRIRIKNDFGGEQWSTIEVSAGGSRYVLKARQSALMPKGTTVINFGYQGQHEYRRYTVECPERFTRGILIKLIDVDSGRISGGCRKVWSQRSPGR